MKLPHFILLLIIHLLSSCNNDNKQKSISAEENEKGQALPINAYIRKFSVIQLPFYFNGWNGYNIDTSKFFAISQKSTDTLFYKIENDEIVYGYGLLQTLHTIIPYFILGREMIFIQYWRLIQKKDNYLANQIYLLMVVDQIAV